MKLAIPDLISNSYFPALAASELGCFEREGIEVSTELIFPVDRAYAALRDGAVDFVGGAAHGALAAFPEWRGVRLLGALAQGMYWFLVMRSDLGIARGDLAALKGRRIGGAPWVDMGLRRLLIASGLDPIRDQIDIAPVPGATGSTVNFGLTAAAALMAGKIDGFWANGMATELAVKEGAGTIVLDVRRGDGPPGCFDYTMPVLATTDQLIERSPDIAAAALRALVAAQAALKDKDSQVRSNAALALGNTKDPRAVEPLIAALKDRDSNVREHVADALLIARHRSTEVNAIDKEGNTALNRADGHWSGDKEHEDLILALIDAGADVNATGKYGTPVIFNAARFGRLSVVKKLVEKGANLSFKTREGNIFGSGRTPLDLAASSEVWQYLRSKGAETGRTDYDKALFDAAKEGVPEAVAYFLQKGGNPNTKFDGDFADFSVTKMGGFNMPSLRVVKYRGITALHYACFGGVESVVRLLVENGASVSTADADAQTPLDFALFREHNDIVSYLRSVQAPEGVGGDGMHIRAAIENMPTGGWHQWRECSVMPNYNFLKERPDIKPMSLGHMKGTAIAFKGKWGSWDEEPVSFRNGMVGSCKAIPSYVKEGTEAKYLQRHYIFKKGDWAEVKE